MSAPPGSSLRPSATVLTAAQIEGWRRERYRCTPERRVRTEAEACAFINEVGLAYLFGQAGTEMPTLWWAVSGARCPMPRDHDDPDIGRVWTWKDTLPGRKAVYYGKLLRSRPTLLSLELLPDAYALSPNYGDPLDYVEQYEAGLLSVGARNIYEVLLKEGAMPTSHLRVKAGLAGGGAIARQFDAAIAELESQLKIAKVGVADSGRWHYAYVYDLFVRRYPEVPEQARQISTDQAMDVLLLRYLENVLVQNEGACQRLFGWDPWEWERLTARLVKQGSLLQNVHAEGIRQPAIAHRRAVSASRH